MTDAETIDDTTPAAKLVLKVLEESDGALRKSEIVEQTRLCNRTAGYGLRQLQEIGVVDRRPDVEDARGYEYFLTDG